jgi:hypothetical protein
MKHCPQTTLATATARAQRLENEVAGVLQGILGTCLNTVFIAERLTALRGVHRRQVPRLQELTSHR